MKNGKDGKIISLFDAARIDFAPKPAKEILTKQLKDRISTRTIKAVFKALRSLPMDSRCPCCKKGKHRDAFGIRVMRRDSNGIPLRIRMHSWCQACRVESGGAKRRKPVWTSVVAARIAAKKG